MSSQKPKIKPCRDVMIEQAFELEALRAEIKRLRRRVQELEASHHVVLTEVELMEQKQAIEAEQRLREGWG